MPKYAEFRSFRVQSSKLGRIFVPLNCHSTPTTRQGLVKEA